LVIFGWKCQATTKSNDIFVAHKMTTIIFLQIEGINESFTFIEVSHTFSLTNNLKEQKEIQ
jgi:hypothetical protein